VNHFFRLIEIDNKNIRKKKEQIIFKVDKSLLLFENLIG